MANQRRKCRLAESKHRGVDLRMYEQLIIDTINKTVPNKNPKVMRETCARYLRRTWNTIRSILPFPKVSRGKKQITLCSLDSTLYKA